LRFIISAVSGLTEIQEAIDRLSAEERGQLWDRFQACAAGGFEEGDELLADLDQAERSIREGKGIPIEDALRRLSERWGIK
jgi:hypothetical protein